MTDYHAVLGVPQGATQEEIKKAFKKKALETHPDRNDGKDEEFKKVNEAYQILSGKAQPPRQQEQQPSQVDIQEAVNEFMKHARRNAQGFGFDPFRSRSAPLDAEAPPKHDHDIKISFTTTLEEVKRGATFNINITKSKDCQKCSGRGADRKDACTTCWGSGIRRETRQDQGYTFISEKECDKCQSTGYVFVNKCNDCKGFGYHVYQEKHKVDLKVKT